MYKASGASISENNIKIEFICTDVIKEIIHWLYPLLFNYKHQYGS
jgi:hypothetical protein